MEQQPTAESQRIMEQQPTAESQRDAMLAWLEQGDNFLRVTAFSSPSGPYSRRGLADLHQAERMESRALDELASSVNVASPRAQWDVKLAKQMLKHYLMEFKSTAREASRPGFILSTTDEAFGIRTIEDKLNSMCPHFVRLQMLHNPRRRAAMKGRISVGKNQENASSAKAVVIPSHRKEQELLRQAAEHQTDQTSIAASKPQDRTELPKLQQDKRMEENSVEDGEDMTRRDLGLRLRSAGTATKQKVGDSPVTTQQNNKKISSTPLTPPKNGKKRAVSVKFKQQQQQKKKVEELQKVKVSEMPGFVVLTSDDEEELPFQRSKTSVKKGRRLRAGVSKSARSEEEGSLWLKKKLRRVESPGNGRKYVRKVIQDPKPADPANTAAAPGPAPSQEKVAGAPKPVEKLPERGQDGVESILPSPKAVQFPNATASEPQQGQDTVVQNPSDSQNEVLVSDVSPSVEEALLVSTSIEQAPVNPVQVAAPSASAPPRYQVPNDLRSAIAQVFSQRQELLTRWGRNQINPPDFSDNDYAASGDDEDVDEEFIEETAAYIPSKSQSRKKAPLASTASETQHCPAAPHTTATYNRKAAPLRGRGSPASSAARRQTPTLMVGHIPPLLNVPNTLRETNLKRKHGFFTAKKLAFEQLKWIHENELQQREMELLRREMETREAFAQTETKLQRIKIRTDVIERLVLSGTSFEDIAERLTLLEVLSSSVHKDKFSLDLF